MQVSLIEHWQEFTVGGPAHVHAHDKPYINSDNFKVFAEVESTGIANEGLSMLRKVQLERGGFYHHLELSLLPQPFAGDLKRADIFALYLNPGLSPGDYEAEFSNSHFARRLKVNLSHNSAQGEYPFLWLDPLIKDVPGAKWWRQKLKYVLSELQTMRGCSELKATQELAQRFACVELFPYHSKRFDRKPLDRAEISSCETAKDFLRLELLPAARRGEKLVIVVRGVKYWGVTDRDENVIVYDPKKEARSGSLGRNSRGGGAIVKWLQSR